MFGILTIALFSLPGMAQKKPKDSNDKVETVHLKVKAAEEITTYQFNSVADFEENSEKILDEITSNALLNKKEENGELTIEISITLTIGLESTTITGSVMATYLTAIAEVKKLRPKLIAIAME